MTDFRARISKVRMKDGPTVHVLENRANFEELGDYRGHAMASARYMAERHTDDSPLVGYFFIGLYGDGTHSCGMRVDNEKCHVPLTLMPAYVEEIVRRYAVTDGEARDVFHEMFEWVEG